MSDGPGDRDFGRRDYRSELSPAARRAQERERARREGNGKAVARPAQRRAAAPRPPARRPPSRRRRGGAGGGRALMWLLGIGVVVVLLAVAASKTLRGRDSGSAATPAAPEVPVRVTFPEGLRREDMARILEEKTSLSGDAYLQATAAGVRGERLAGVSTPRSLEGFLFPATYDVYRATTVAQLVDQQLGAYDQHTSGVAYAKARRKNLTRYDVLIIASMVEREVRVPAERRRVAGIIYNRLHNGMRLDIDATVQYALGSWKTTLTQADLNIDSPYNTRRFKGLPPGPISNPGEASIHAAADPEVTPYLYYVARNDGSGGHYFATTAAEFERAVARSRGNAGK